MTNPFLRQIQNRNFLSPVGFKFSLSRAPKLSYFANTANIPGLTLGVTEQPNYLRTIPIPGDMMEFDDFRFRFLVDENLENYFEIQKWMRGLGFPESLKEIYDFQKETEYTGKQLKSTQMNLYSDGTLQILTSAENTNYLVKFKDLFPYSLSELSFDATDTDIQYFTAEVSFKYTMYNITDVDNIDQI